MFGGIMSGVIGMGIYPTDSEENIAYKILHTNSRVIFVSDAKKQEKVLKLHEAGMLKFPDGSQKLNTVVCWGPDAKKLECTNLRFMTWSEFKEIGDASSSKEAEKRSAKTKPGNVAFIIYTSGNYNKRKSVKLSHLRDNGSAKRVYDFS